MSVMNNSYLDAIADHGTGLIDFLGLVTSTGGELSGGSPAYARMAVTWTSDGAGIRRPDADITFNVPASTTVGGWRAFASSSAGADEYGGADLDNEIFASQGEYRLIAAESGIKHEV